MIRKSAMLVVALLAFGAGAAHAGSWWLGANAGMGFPTGDYGDAAATGWNFGGTATNMVNDSWGIGADLGYHAWGGSDDLNDALEATFGPGSEFNWSATQATGHAIYRFPTHSTTRPYMKAGVGIYNVSGSLETPSGDESDSEMKFGFNFGGGMDIQSRGNMAWGFNAAYHVIPAEDDFGADLSAFTLGVRMMWGMGGSR